jgi:hypothetical protein
MRMIKTIARRAGLSLALLSLPAVLAVVATQGAAARVAGPATTASAVTSSGLGSYSPTFAGPAATGCASGCNLLDGPYHSPSTAHLSGSSAARTAAGQQASAASPPAGAKELPSPALRKNGTDPTPSTVSCEPLGAGCDRISPSAGGATGVKGLNAVDSGTMPTNILTPRDIEPPDQGLCAGNGYVVETNNIGEILVFNTRLQRVSSVIPLDTLMGLTGLGYSSGGDISCLYDYSNGGHWFFTEIVSKTSEADGGPFTGCFSGTLADSCSEGIAVTKGSSPFGPYNVYFANADYNPAEPGAPYLLNDFAKIATTRDAFEMFYDEFPLNSNVPGLGGGFFNGAQELAFNKNALEWGLPATLPNGRPDPFLTVAIENMGLLPTPNGTCTSDDEFHAPGITCWYSVIPAEASDPSQWDNSHGGSGFMLDTLDYYGQGDTRIAVFDWTGLGNLNSPGCATCSGIRFGGQLFSGVEFYYGEGFLGAQKAGPIPLGNECGAAQNPPTTTPPGGCPEGGIATNGDNFTQVAQAQGQLWGAVSTEVDQTFSSESSPEVHQGGAYWVVGTSSFDRTGMFSLTSQGYVTAAHEDIEFPAMAASDSGYRGGAIMTFTVNGNGGPTGADHGGYYPSTAYGRLTSTSGGLLGSVVNIADLGQSPQDGFTEYQGYPGATRPRWGDYSWAVYLPSTGRIYFANNYIQYPNCTGSAFTLTVPTCGGTRDDLANWGTSVNSITP